MLGVIVALLLGASVLMGTVAFSGQRFFEWQLEQRRAALSASEERAADAVEHARRRRPLAGIVSTQAQTMLPATPQRTVDALRTAPTPTMAPVMVWVVDTGMPSAVARNSVIAPPVSAQKPPTGLSLVMRWPMVLTMRQPPNSVPAPIAR